MFSHLRKGLRSLFSDIRLSNCLVSFFASAFLAFGLYQVHAVSQVTEGGVLGMMLLLEHWTGLSPSVSGLVMDAACYALGWRLLGRSFLVYSGISSLGFSAAYRVLECFPRLWPGLSNMPLLASVLGAIFVGLGAGLWCARPRRDGRGRRARDEPFAPHAAAHRTHLSGKRPHRAGAVGELHPLKAARVFAFDGAALGAAHRACAARSAALPAHGGRLADQRRPS